MRKKPICQSFFIALLCISSYNAKSSTETLQLTVPPFEQSTASQAIYFYKLLDLALTKTQATDGAFTVNLYPEAFSIDRFLAALKNDTLVNIVWTTNNLKRNEELLPIRVSLLGELNNYRLLLIRKEDQEKFSQVNTIEQLRKLRAGLGSQWPDTEIMQKNNFHVVTSVTHDSLFKMLEAKRFDYFPRGLYEIWNELKLQQAKNFIIEPHLMLYYELPFYFFVNKNNRKLAERIERGLKLAIADGSFEQLLLSIPGFKQGYDEQFNTNRTLIRLTPLSQGTDTINDDAAEL